MQSSNSTCAGCGLVNRVGTFLMQPFTSGASVTDWLLLAGMILVAAYLWARVNRTIDSMI
jgi:hypothetical protein